MNTLTMRSVLFRRFVPGTVVGRTLAAIVVVKLILHAAAIWRYGYFRDELYYLASTDHLAWGYVDHPPLSITVLAVIRTLFGDSLLAVRFVPALAGAAVVIVTALIARSLGGGRFAQALAALSATMAPVFLAAAHYYSMNVFDELFWAVAALALLHALDRAEVKHWLVLGCILGIGFLNKISILWLCGGMFVGLALTSHRRVLVQPAVWIAALTDAAIASPHVLWQIAHGWPTLEFMRNAASIKMTDVSPLQFLLDQVLSMNPGAAPVWVAGLLFGLAGGARSPGRALAWMYVAVFALLVLAGRSRASYLAPAYPPLFALGGVAWERFTETRRGWIRPALAVLVAAFGLGIVPFALPVLPVDVFVRYQSAMGLAPRTKERQEMGLLPQQYADMFGWEEMAALAGEAYGRLTPEERAHCRIFGQNYGEAGAVDLFGRRRGLPPALSGHNSYWLWGPGDDRIDVLIIIGGTREDNARYFDQIEIVGQTRSPWAMPYERNLDISIARRPKADIRDLWPQLKKFV
jgi:dolichyl-phosphate-mannose-protein mannosyltransferase